MIAQFLKPKTVEDVLALKAEYGSKAAYLAGGSKLNAAFFKEAKTVAISLSFLGWSHIVRQGDRVEIGATVTLQSLIDHPDVPQSLKVAAQLVYSRNLRNQATIGGEIAASQDASVLLPLLLVLEAQLLLEKDRIVSLEEYLKGKRDTLIQKVMLPNAFIAAATRKISHMVDGLVTLTAAVALTKTGEMRIALEGVSDQAMRLLSLEKKGLSGEALEKAVSEAISPKSDLLKGSREYKKYIAGIVVADLLNDCHEQEKK